MTLRLLLVEDNPGDARLIEALLEHEEQDVEIDWVDSLDEGVKRLTQQKYDAVLLDLSLPDSRGIESVATTHLFDTETPIVVLTGLDDDDAAFQALREGAQDYLVKGTIDGKTLLRTVRFAKQRVEAQSRLEQHREGLKHEPVDATVRGIVCPPGSGMLNALAEQLKPIMDDGRKILYVGFDRPATVLRGRFSRLGLDPKSIQFMDASGQLSQADSDNHIFVCEDARDLDRVSVEVESAVAVMGGNVVVVVDSINSLLLHHGVDVMAVFCHGTANRLRLLQVPVDFLAIHNQEWPYLADRLSFLDEEVHIGAVPQEGAGSDPSFA